MLEVARGLMVNLYLEYGLCEASLKASELVDELLNLGGEIMEVVKAINTGIMPIQISSEVFTEISWKNYNAIDIVTSIKANELVPIFEMYIRSKEYELGLKRNLWSSEQLKKFEDEFAIKYLT